MDRIFGQYKYILQKRTLSLVPLYVSFSLFICLCLSLSVSLCHSLSMSIYVSLCRSLSMSLSSYPSFYPSFYPSLWSSLCLSIAVFTHVLCLFSASIYHEVRLEGHSHSFAHYARYADIGVAQTSAESTGDLGGWAWEGRRDPKSYYTVFSSHSFHLSTI